MSPNRERRTEHGENNLPVSKMTLRPVVVR